MSICDGCGGEYGHSSWCPEARVYKERMEAAKQVEAPLKEEIRGLRKSRGSLERKIETLRRALLDVLTSNTHEDAKRIAKNVLSRG